MRCKCGAESRVTTSHYGQFVYCPSCRQIGGICGKCGKYMNEVDGIISCECGNKETFCKNPIFSFNGVYDMDRGECPGDWTGS